MGRTVIIEESVEDYISSLYGSHKWQIGLIIGQVKLNYVCGLSNGLEFTVFSVSFQ